MTTPNDKLTCRFCERGTYRDVVDPKRDRHTLHNEGLDGLGRIGGRGWRVLECDECQHIQLFRLTAEESERRGWNR
jgi:hypothetical protein